VGRSGLDRGGSDSGSGVFWVFFLCACWFLVTVTGGDINFIRFELWF
jgi:hypothetical protein